MNLREALYKAGREYVIQALTDTGGNVPRTAQIVGCKRASLYKILKRYDVDPDACRAPETITRRGRHRGRWDAVELR